MQELGKVDYHRAARVDEMLPPELVAELTDKFRRNSQIERQQRAEHYIRYATTEMLEAELERRGEDVSQ